MSKVPGQRCDQKNIWVASESPLYVAPESPLHIQVRDRERSIVGRPPDYDRIAIHAPWSPFMRMWYFDNTYLRSRNAFGRAVNRPSSFAHAFCTRIFLVQIFCLTWYKVLVQTLFYLPDFMVQIFFWYNFSGTISFSGTKTFGFAFGLRSPICVRWTRSAISHLRSRTPMTECPK